MYKKNKVPEGFPEGIPEGSPLLQRDARSALPGITEIVKRISALSPFQSLAARDTNLPRGDDVSMVKAMNVLLSEAETLRKTVEEQTERITHLEALATTDELTATFNRRGFEKELNRVLARADRSKEEGVLVYVDLDDFKPVNDTHGHAAGDEVLKQAARVLKDNVRDMDVVGRLGGDEFAVILVGSEREKGLERAEMLNDMLNDSWINWDGAIIPIRASFGMQSYQAGDQADQLISSADAAMYKIKQVKEQVQTHQSDQGRMMPIRPRPGAPKITPHIALRNARQANAL